MEAKKNKKQQRRRNERNVTMPITIISLIIVMVATALSATFICTFVFAENTNADNTVTNTIYNYDYNNADSLKSRLFAVNVNNQIATIKIADTTTTTTKTTTETTTEITTSDYYHTLYYTNSYIGNSSGLNPEQINGLISDTGLAGLGEVIYNAEQKYGVDAYFILSVASLESGYGTSNRFKRTNDLFGMLAINYFDGVHKSIDYFANLISTYPVKYSSSGVNMTPYGIAIKYCPDPGYAETVTSIMNKYVRKANNLY